VKRKKLSFATVLSQAPKEIKVSCQGVVTVLTTHLVDKKWAQEPCFAVKNTMGDGTKCHPYEVRAATGISPYYGIINLWWLFRPTEPKNNSDYPLIKVNDWIIQLRQDGIVTEMPGGYEFPFFRLLPEKMTNKKPEYLELSRTGIFLLIRKNQVEEAEDFMLNPEDNERSMSGTEYLAKSNLDVMIFAEKESLSAFGKIDPRLKKRLKKLQKDFLKGVPADRKKYKVVGKLDNYWLGLLSFFN
jgi:hypothetical protein